MKTRNNGSIGRDEVIKMVGSVVRNLEGESSVDLKTPDLAIIVEVVQPNPSVLFWLVRKTLNSSCFTRL